MELTEQTAPNPAAGKKRPRRTDTAVQRKKLQQQLEGLDLVAKLVRELLNAGLGSMGGTDLKTCRERSKQLGDHCLPGPQRLLDRLILEIEDFRRDGEERHYQAAAAVLEKLWALIKRSRRYLEEKLAGGDTGPDGDLLFEELGGVWKLEGLDAQGLVRENVRLVQLAFWVERDDARREYADTGCWADVDSGEVCFTYNFRPFQAVKYVKREDTVFGTARVPRLACYPGSENRRVRWDVAEIDPLTPEDLTLLRAHAAVSVEAEARAAKDYLKKMLSKPLLFRLLRYERIGTADGVIVLQDAQGDTVALDDAPYLEATVRRLSLLPDPALLERQALLGAFFYDGAERRLKLQPLSIVTDSAVVRLLY